MCLGGPCAPLASLLLAPLSFASFVVLLALLLLPSPTVLLHPLCRTSESIMLGMINLMYLCECAVILVTNFWCLARLPSFCRRWAFRRALPPLVVLWRTVFLSVVVNHSFYYISYVCLPPRLIVLLSMLVCSDSSARDYRVCLDHILVL